MSTAVPDDLPALGTEVLVVGAGPTGLMAALVLARRGVPSLVIDGKEGPTHESRALVIHARSMEILDQLGIAGPVLAGATTARRIQLRPQAGAMGADFASTQTGSTPFPGVRIFEQSRTEELLASTLAAEGHPVRWRHRLLDLGENDATGVTALVEGPEGLQRIRARRLIAADGARSPVRHRLGLPFEGVTDDATFCVADLHGVSGAPSDALSARFGQRTFAVLFPMGPQGHVRLVCLSPTADPQQAEVLAEAQADLGIQAARVEWFSAYRVHHRVAGSFRRGAVLLAGDAAHVHSPLGGQGMNTGLQDAHHLAHLLADVAVGHLAPSALDRYESDRRPVALTLIEITDRAFGLIARRGRGVATARRLLGGVMARAAPRVLSSRLGPRLGGWLGQYRIRYRAAAEGEGLPRWAADPMVGRRLPPTADNLAALRAMRWQLHSYGGTAARPPAVPAWIQGPLTFAADPAGRLRPDRLHLVRSDGFVAAAFPLHAGATAVADVREALVAHGALEAPERTEGGCEGE